MTSTVLARHSLKTRITLATLAIFVISIWSLAFYAGRELREDMQVLLSEQQFSAVSILAADVNQALEDRLRGLEKLAGQSGPAMREGPAAMQAFIDSHLLLQSLFSGGVIAYRLDGIAIAEAPLAAGRIGLNYMDVDTVAAALREGKTTIGRPVMGKKLLAPVFGMTAPIRDRSEEQHV